MNSVIIDAVGTYVVTLNQNATLDYLYVGDAFADVTLNQPANTLLVDSVFDVAATSTYPPRSCLRRG